MSTQERQPGQDPREKQQQNTDRNNNPGKPGNDPDQTPERETTQAPVAKPQKPEQKR